ncbi:MAG TPA: hypothetical protein VJ418_03935 [Streptosporangiaceae bacterium]|nr:hypothetical protein [Streptosporangiaceae bacterium]
MTGNRRVSACSNQTHCDRGPAARAREYSDEDGVWTTVLWTAVDREDRGGGSAGAGQG